MAVHICVHGRPQKLSKVGGGGKRKKGPHMVKKVPHNEKNVAKNAPNIAPIFFSVGRPSTLVPHPCRRL